MYVSLSLYIYIYIYVYIYIYIYIYTYTHIGLAGRAAASAPRAAGHGLRCSGGRAPQGCRARARRGVIAISNISISATINK